jgi:hypothetical protein
MPVGGKARSFPYTIQGRYTSSAIDSIVNPITQDCTLVMLNPHHGTTPVQTFDTLPATSVSKGNPDNLN